MMLPILQNAGDGKEHTGREAIEAAARAFHLTDSQRAELLPSGTQPALDNRANWARFYLTRAGLLASLRRGIHKITERGLEVLRNNPNHISTAMLRQYPEFVQFQTTRRGTLAPGLTSEELLPPPIDHKTPEEAIELGYQQLRTRWEAELLALVKNCSPKFFEQLVVELLVKMGYGGSQHDAGRALGRSGDGGIDGIIKEDKLGLDAVYIQAKRWESSVVGRPEIQRFAGALMGVRARKGVFITTASFSNEARNYVDSIDSKIVLIDGNQLAQLMLDHDIGVSTTRTYEIKRVDSDYFEE
jgi:restriction system protein